jgi:hypothetical protein
MTSDIRFVRFVVVRAGDEHNLQAAAIAARVRPDLVNETAFRRAVTAALTRWFCETQAGRRAWESSDGDFNAGGLARLCAGGVPKSLLARLQAQGIASLSARLIEEADVAQDWTYDTVLFDANCDDTHDNA